MRIYLVYIQDFHGYLCNICGAFTSQADAQQYINENGHQVVYRAFTTAKFFYILPISVSGSS